jgi:hypothetical protein
MQPCGDGKEPYGKKTCATLRKWHRTLCDSVTAAQKPYAKKADEKCDSGTEAYAKEPM